MCPCMST